ncbi:MAG: serine hydrolase, partial [Acidobacteria bacterium]|nr:serine hydrolase [Acidobacteriota bacterium]
MNDGSRLEPFLGDLVAGDAARAAVALVGDARGVRSVHAVGTSSDARFDLASLTKPFVATLALVLHQAGELRLDSPLGQVWRRSEASLGPPLEACALELLLRHRSGLAPWAPLYALAKTPERALPLLLAGKLVEPAPAGVAYSDLGYVLWGLTAAESLGAPVEEL